MHRDLETTCAATLGDRDIYEAIKEIPGYRDITVGDFLEIYRVAFRKAQERLYETIPTSRIMTRKIVSVLRAA